MKMPNAAETIERLARESERQRMQIEQLQRENADLRQQLKELHEELTK